MGNERVEIDPIRPELQSFILADQVYVDARTGKKVIAGTFDRLWAVKFPSMLSRTTFAYLRFVGGRGKFRIALSFVDLSDGSVLLESGEMAIDKPDPLEHQEVVMEVPPFPMPHPGQYAFDAYCDGEPAGQLRITVSKTEESEGDHDPSG